MTKKKFDADSAFKRIAGIEETDAPEEKAAPATPEARKSKPREKVEYVGAYYRISPQHIKAIKIREAFSDDPKDKDKSSIVRAALDMYLREELKKLES